MFFLIAGTPFGFGTKGSPNEGTIGADALMSSKDGREDPVNDASDPLMKQEKFFKPAIQDMNTVFKIGLADRRSRAGSLRSGGRGERASIQFNVSPVGEEPIQSDQNKMGEDLLFDTAQGFAVKVFDINNALAHLVKLLDAPSAMVDVDELLKRITLHIEQGRSQAK